MGEGLLIEGKTSEKKKHRKSKPLFKQRLKTITHIPFITIAENVKDWDRINSSNLGCYQFTRLFQPVFQCIY